MTHKGVEVLITGKVVKSDGIAAMVADQNAKRQLSFGGASHYNTRNITQRQAQFCSPQV